MMQRFSGEDLRPMASLAIIGGVFALACYGILFTVADFWQASVEIDGLHENEQVAIEAAAKASVEPPVEVASTDAVGSSFIAPDRASALSFIQQTLRRLVAPPAILDMIHSLDMLDTQGLVAVRASFRIASVAPDAKMN